MSMVAEIVRDSRGLPTVFVEGIFIADCDLEDVDAEAEAQAVQYYLTVAEDYNLCFRIYRTPQGLRVICVSDIVRPKSPLGVRLLQDLNSDYRYNISAKHIGKFSARLGAKATRIGVPVPEKFHYYALLPKEQRAWDAVYNALAVNYKACEFILQTSECEMPPEIVNFIALHDERTKCFSDLPMA